ncbi:M10 family metallopeptidase C-terminal domain-containing protein [Microvirga sp. ACRRW]|uniref:M10 family metallopeptidase n=1 Tax=Microvirga sp. ACRRW TaxID=2918205 RepID=UPI001EF594A5|nr:M10 family metallopeptidase [Microvirga sp. ACRRW]MCG7392167.1 M10 family metallopeptidase C-terminal domain-containing protein [Microvirga sp. ACRRW]
MSSTLIASSPSNIYVSALLGGTKWATNSLTYSFPASASSYGYSYGSGEAQNKFAAFMDPQQEAARTALKLYASVANLAFSEIVETTSQHADIRFARSNSPDTAWAYYPNDGETGGDVWVNTSSSDYASPRKGNYAYLTLIHEIGHALGLEHAHEGTAMPLNRDSLEYTIMSYRSYAGASTSSGYVNETWGYAQSLMMYDIAALQHLYGANYKTNSGNTVYAWTPAGRLAINGATTDSAGANRIFQTLWDGGGTDTYDFRQYTTGLKINLNPGAWTITSRTQLAKLDWSGAKLAAGNIANALLYNNDMRSLIENALGGSGNDTITGNQGANSLKGNGGNDKLNGGGGKDVLVGGSGKDILYGGADGDTLYGSSGADVFLFRSAGDSPRSARDTIKDFKRGEDHIDLRPIDANTNAAGNQAFTFIGKAAFTGKAGELRFLNGLLSADVNGDMIADMQVNVAKLTGLAKSDFYL